MPVDEPSAARDRVVVTGGAGFLGSHLCDHLIVRGYDVLCVDNLSTGSTTNIEHLVSHPRFGFVEHDVCEPLVIDRVAGVFHLASPASPQAYARLPFETLAAGSAGTWNCLRLAHGASARFLFASTSEVYGEPLQHPQREDSWGNVNPVGPRSVYDEAKRFGEALAATYARELGTTVRIARLFNVYGPRMQADDGRVVSNFIAQVLDGLPLTIYGDGSHTRSYSYVSDTVDALIRLYESDCEGPVNIGDTDERTVNELAQLIVDLTGSTTGIEYRQLPENDPTRRLPDISRAIAELGWRPTVALEEGLARTIEAAREHRRGVEGDSPLTQPAAST